MDYTTFETYPLQILGIDESYNDELTAIEDFVINEIAYSGNLEDIKAVLPYFVFYTFCKKRNSEITTTNGEQSKVSEFTVSSVVEQVAAWNIGVKKLDAICVANDCTANEIYRSKISMI